MLGGVGGVWSTMSDNEIMSDSEIMSDCDDLLVDQRQQTSHKIRTIWR